MSVEEPAPNGTMMRTGLDGYWAETDTLKSARNSAASTRSKVRMAASSLCFS